jgi:hypothetical protein
VRDGGRLGQGVLLGAGPLEENIWSLVNTTLTGRSTASTPDGAEEDITVPVRERRRQFDRTVRVDRRGLLSGNPCRTDGFVVGATAVLQLLLVEFDEVIWLVAAVTDRADLLVGSPGRSNTSLAEKLRRQCLMVELEKRRPEYGVPQGVGDDHGHVLTDVLDSEIREGVGVRAADRRSVHAAGRAAAAVHGSAR